MKLDSGLESSFLFYTFIGKKKLFWSYCTNYEQERQLCDAQRELLTYLQVMALISKTDAKMQKSYKFAFALK